MNKNTFDNLAIYQNEWINVMNLIPYSFTQIPSKINRHVPRNDIEPTFGFELVKALAPLNILDILVTVDVVQGERF